MYRNETAGAIFIDTVVTTICQKLLEDIEKCNYFTLLMDGSTDSSFTEQEPISVLFLGSKGTPSVKFLSIEKVEIAYVDGLKLQFYKHLKGLN